jgi:6-phosphogluconolactonase
MPWGRLHLMWGDERCVPPDHADSNYRMVREALLARTPVPRQQVYRMRGEDPDPAAAAADYERLLLAHFGGLPRFDLILLGIGTDGHTASLFPDAPAVAERERLVVATRAPAGQPRITLTLPVLNNAALVCFLARGADKAHAVSAALQAREGDASPAGRVRPRAGRLVWLVDAAAGGEARDTVAAS